MNIIEITFQQLKSVMDNLPQPSIERFYHFPFVMVLIEPDPVIVSHSETNPKHTDINEIKFELIPSTHGRFEWIPCVDLLIKKIKP